jgi:hypothetical protein
MRSIRSNGSICVRRSFRELLRPYVDELTARSRFNSLEAQAVFSSMIAITLFLFSLSRASSLQHATQVVQKMRCVHVAGDNLRSVAHDFRQNVFASSVNECDVDQLNDASAGVPAAVRFCPS